jgi:archaemetzincin
LDSYEKIYKIKTVKLDKIPIPQETFINTITPRYRADKLIKYLKENKADTLAYIIGVTNHDISFTKRDNLGNIKKPENKYKDWGIFGLGYKPGSSCIISTYRVGSKNERFFIERIKKISIHELGHNLGLDHCRTTNCVMQDAVETIKTIDKVRVELCNECKKKIM